MFQWLKGINGSDTAKDAPRPVSSDVNDLKGQVAAMRAVRAALDPQRIMNPSVLV